MAAVKTKDTAWLMPLVLTMAVASVLIIDMGVEVAMTDPSARKDH